MNKQMRQRVNIDDPDYWWCRAEELLAKAEGMRDFRDSCTLIDAAESSARLARVLEFRRAQIQKN